MFLSPKSDHVPAPCKSSTLWHFYDSFILIMCLLLVRGGYMHVSASGQKTTSDPLELELQVVVVSWQECWEPLRSPARAVTSPNCWALVALGIEPWVPYTLRQCSTTELWSPVLGSFLGGVYKISCIPVAYVIPRLAFCEYHASVLPPSLFLYLS